MQTIPTPKRFLVIPAVSIALIAVTLTACSTIAPYSQYAYQQATSIKVDALALMDKATEPYTSHATDVQNLETEIDKAYEYAKSRPKNELSTKQWALLKDPDHNLLGGFLKRWKAQSTLSAVFIKEAEGLVGDAFDTISGLESGKIKASNIQS
jgi:hypothetical protein